MTYNEWNGAKHINKKFYVFGKFSGVWKWRNYISGSDKTKIFIYKVPFTLHSLGELIHYSTNAKEQKNRTTQCLQKRASKLVSSLPEHKKRRGFSVFAHIFLLYQYFFKLYLLQCSAVQSKGSSVVQYIVVHCKSEICYTVKFNAVQWIELLWIETIYIFKTFQWSALHREKVQCNSMNKNVDLCSAVKCTAAHPRLTKSPEEEEKSLYVWQTRCSRGCPTNSLVIHSLSHWSFS